MATTAETAPNSRLLAGVRSLARRIPVRLVRPWHVLGLLLIVQWAGVVAFAFTVRHNGWLYYQGGDQIFHYTSGSLLTHGQIPPTRIAYEWPALLAPLSWIFGPSFVAGLPVIVVVNVVVLLPVALLCIYSLGSRLGGSWYGIFAASLWVLFPWLGVRYADAGYHAKFTEQFVPQALGLTAMVDFPALIALLVAAVFTVRALETRSWTDGAVAGLATGVAIGLKASNFIFLPFPLLTLIVARRWRQAVPFAIATLPALATLALWKERGLGNLPAFSEPGVRLASGTNVVAFNPVHKYIHLDWNHLYNNILGIKEHFWSVRLVEWVPFAGLIALARRSRLLLLLFGGWFFAYLIAKGTYQYANVEDGSFFRFLMPAFPPFLLMCASLPLLIPRFAPRLRRPVVRELPARRAIVGVAGASVVFALAPFVAIAVASPLKATTTSTVQYNQNLTPVTNDFELRAEPMPLGTRLSWRKPGSQPAKFFYYVLRAPRGQDETCSSGSGAAVCELQATPIVATRGTTYVDPTPGAWSYRVGAVANWLNSVKLGDVFLLSPPVTVRA